MIQATLAELRKSADFFQTDEVISIINGRKKQDIGFFVPNHFRVDFIDFLTNLKNRQRLENAKKAAAAQALDPIGDEAVGDGIA